jgi:gas vesicle protein
MGKTAEELRDDIELRREYLTRDFEAIGDRVSPQRVMERRTEALRGRLRNAKESIMGQADHAQGKAIDVRDKAAGVADGARSTLGDATHKAQAGVHEAAEKAGEVPDLVREKTEGNPLAVGLVAFGFGLLAATVLPESRRERQLARRVQPTLEDAARTAVETGRTIADDVKPAVQESASRLQESAKESAQEVAEQAKGAAKGVGDDGKRAAANVRDAAKS